MSPIQDDRLGRYKFIVLYDDERVMDAVAALASYEMGADWWHLVVDLETGGYATAPFSTLTEAISSQPDDAQRQVFLSRLLGDLVTEGRLPLVEVIADKDTEDFDSAYRKASHATIKTAIVTAGGEVVGVIPAGSTRAGGLFNVGLVQLAGQYADLPERGLISRRRRKKIEEQPIEEPDVTPKDTEEGPDAG